MCGIMGLVPNKPSDPVESEKILKVMGDAIFHRGPDDDGYHVEPNIAIGMRRLSIIDVTGGHQPMTSNSGRRTIVFNGELYNYRTLRKELEQKGVKFKTHSDTEVVLEAFDAWGDDVFNRLQGMFGVAVWDHHLQELTIVRDGMGQKSIYYAETSKGLLFASEIKAILATGLVERALDVQAMSHYMGMRYLPADSTFFKNISKLQAAHFLKIKANQIKVDRYWNPYYQPKHTMGEEGIIEELDSILKVVVNEHLMSEVPLGAFLSGGIDSSLVVAYASPHLSDPLSTFSIGVNDDSQSELPWAREVAERYKTNHIEKIAEPDLAGIAPRVIQAMEEPADPFAFGNYVVSEIASDHVTVALGGDGGDEIFSGYDRYIGQQLAEIYSHFPKVLRHHLIRPMLNLVPESFGYKSVATKLRWIDHMADSSGFERYADSAAFLRFSHSRKSSLFAPEIWRDLEKNRSEELLREFFEDGSADAFLDKMLHTDSMTRLADHQLPIVDKMSMAHSLEVRSPFLDKRVVEFALKIPAPMQMKKRRIKYVTRKLGERYLSKGLLYRKKQGFGFPLALWFRGALKPLIQAVVDESTMIESGIFQRSAMQQLVDEHVNGGIDHNYRLWMLFNIELFNRLYIQEQPVEALEEWVHKNVGKN